MITVNGRLVDATVFPDGTSSLRFPYTGSSIYRVLWRYDDEKEWVTLWNIVHHIRSKVKDAAMYLELPYVPNARMDRVKNDDEVFTLKWFAEFLNSMNFERVLIDDPHSDVCMALIDRAVQNSIIPKIVKAEAYILENFYPDAKLIYCYPDNGASKKYSSIIDGEYVYGVKHRDWRSGAITGFELVGKDAVKDRPVLIVDDICSRGGTFMHTARALREAGAKNVFLYVTHCENTIYAGEILTTDLIDHVFTTDSIYRGDHEKITVIV